jgi:UDP-glucose 4-epimerase
MRILLTGCSGFVGSAVGPRLVAEGHELFCVCRPETSVAFGTKVAWDGMGPIQSSEFPETVDAVIHLAQSRSYRSFPEDSGEMFAVNVAMTMSLLAWAAQARVRHACLVSSGAVYEPFTGSLKEDAPFAPIGFLGASKLASEVIARPFSSVFSLNILRLFFPFGPGQHDRLIPDLVRRVRSGSAIQLSAGGEGVRLVPTFIQDVVEVILTSVESSWTETLNVASPEVLSIREIADKIGQKLSIEPRFEITNRPQTNIVPDLSRLATRFNLDRFTRFEEGLRKTLAEDVRCGAGSA